MSNSKQKSQEVGQELVLDPWWCILIYILTFTASRSFGLSWRYLTIHVITLAVVSWAANSTPIMLSMIWSTVKVCPFSSLEFNKQPKRSFSSNFLSFLSQIILLIILVSLFLAYRENPTKQRKREHSQMELLLVYQIVVSYNWI